MKNFVEVAKKIVCVGRNYALHAKEMGYAKPDRPIIFMKPTSAFLQEGAHSITAPDGCEDLHHEVELAVVFGKRASRVKEAEALDYVAGYALALDMTARDIQGPYICDAMLYLIGLGLAGVEDITVRGLQLVKKSAHVYLECYTSILAFGPQKDELEKFYEKEIILADREMIEQRSDEILDHAEKCDVSLLVVGDPFGATTHADLFLRANERQIPVQVVHNASILNAVGCCGLQLYHFGETVSICFWEDGWQPDSYVDKIERNLERGLHTLCLLDIKVKEQNLENMMKKKKVYDPPRYMTCADAANQLMQIISRRRDTR